MADYNINDIVGNERYFGFVREKDSEKDGEKLRIYSLNTAGKIKIFLFSQPPIKADDSVKKYAENDFEEVKKENLTIGDRVLLRDEKKKRMLCGFVLKVNNKSVELSTKKGEFHLGNYQIFFNENIKIYKLKQPEARTEEPTTKKQEVEV